MTIDTANPQSSHKINGKTQKLLKVNNHLIENFFRVEVTLQHLPLCLLSGFVLVEGHKIIFTAYSWK